MERDEPSNKRFAPNDPFFAEGDRICAVRTKIPIVEPDDDPEAAFRHFSSLRCSSCQETFHTLVLFEAHYNSRHRNECSSCKKSFPTPHFLDLHITEWHDPIFLSKPPDTPKYACIVESCPKLFASYSARKDHVVTQHNYPANFKFMPGERPKDVPEAKEAVAKPCATTSVTVPKRICFGRGSVAAWHRRAAPKQKKHNDQAQDITMKELADTLDMEESENATDVCG